MVYVALQGERVVGGLTAYELPAYSQEGADMYLYDLAVHPDFQRKGVGTALVDGLLEECKRRQVRTCFVQAHLEDAHALHFYRALGGEEEEVAHFEL